MRGRLERLSPWIAGVIAIIAGVFYLWAARDGSIHGYYSPAAYAMSENFHNFLYGAVDSSGWAGLDKIPGSLWPQAASVAIFGYHWWSIILPVVLATVATIVLIYLTVARWLNRPAGVVAALMYAVTPVVAVCAQVNVPEAWLALAFALTAYFTMRAVKGANLWWLIAAGLAIAAGFQAKMLQGWTIWPAVIIVYLICAPVTFWTRIWHLLVAGFVSLVTSLWWILLVTFTPASSRPYVGGSDGNSAWEMVFGYNGLGRFGWWSGRSFVVNMGGDAGLDRIIGPMEAVDLAWLIPLAVMGLIAGLVVAWKRPRIDLERAGWIFFGAFLIAVSAPIIFSSGIHTFYVLAYAPAIAVLASGAVVLAWRGLSSQSYTRWIVIAGLAVQIAWTAWLVVRSAEFTWLLWVTIALGVVALILMLIKRPEWGVAVALVAVLAAPLTWTISTQGPTNDVNPTASTAAMGGPGGGPGGPGGGGQGRPDSMPGGPPSGGMPAGGPPNGGGPNGGPGGMPGSGGQTSEAATWLIAHQTGAPYLVAANSNTASSLVTAGVPGVLTMGGGFQGADPTPTATELANLVATGQLSYVLSSSGGMGGGPGGGPGGGGPGNNSGAAATVTAERNAWITAHCTQVTDAPTGILACTA